MTPAAALISSGLQKKCGRTGKSPRQSNIKRVMRRRLAAGKPRKGDLILEACRLICLSFDTLRRERPNLADLDPRALRQARRLRFECQREPGPWLLARQRHG